MKKVKSDRSVSKEMYNRVERYEAKQVVVKSR